MPTNSFRKLAEKDHPGQLKTSLTQFKKCLLGIVHPIIEDIFPRRLRKNIKGDADTFLSKMAKAIGIQDWQQYQLSVLSRSVIKIIVDSIHTGQATVTMTVSASTEKSAD